jgi:biotin synthase-like enzyme
MVRIAQVGGLDCLFVCYQNYCSHFARGEQCHFCNLVSTSHTYDSVLKKKAVESIGRVAGRAWAEGGVKHILLTGGCFDHQRETSMVAAICREISEQTGLERIPGTILPSPAKGDDIRRYFETGIQAIGYSMEIWDRRLYQAICPGKASGTSHEDFVKSIEEAVGIFGPGNVYGVFVMGLEPRDSLLEGVRALSESGANCVPFVWSPNPGSKLAGHRAPSAAWYCDTVLEAAEIVAAAGVPSGTENHCHQCDGNSLLHDALLAKGIA